MTKFDTVDIYNSMNSIFVQIASYRDTELIPTIEDCISKAKFPENLVFGICWQYDETEDITKYDNREMEEDDYITTEDEADEWLELKPFNNIYYESIEIETGKRIEPMENAAIFPANLYMAPKEMLQEIIIEILKSFNLN